MKKLFLILLCAIGLMSCTDNQRARNWGGTENISLKPNEVLINMTWKKDDLWILTCDTNTNIKYFRESSSWGIWEGEVIIK